MTKQWTNPLEWDSYHDESKFHMWESWCEWYDKWDKDMAQLIRIIVAAKNYRRAQRLAQSSWLVPAHYIAELDAALLDLPRGLQEVDDHGEEKKKES